MTLQTGRAPLGVMGGSRFASVCGQPPFAPPLQLGSADHVSVWPLSPGELLGALHSALVTGC